MTGKRWLAIAVTAIFALALPAASMVVVSESGDVVFHITSGGVSAYSPDGSLLWSRQGVAAVDPTGRCVAVASGRLVELLSASGELVGYADIAQLGVPGDARLVATSCSLVAVASGLSVALIPVDGRAASVSFDVPVTAIGVVGRRAVVGLGDGSVYVLEPSDSGVGRRLVFTGDGVPVWVAVGRGCAYVVFARGDGSLLVYSESGALVGRSRAPIGAVSLPVHVTRDCRVELSGGGFPAYVTAVANNYVATLGGEIYTRRGRLVLRLNTTIYDIADNPDGTVLAVETPGGVRIYRLGRVGVSVEGCPVEVRLGEFAYRLVPGNNTLILPFGDYELNLPTVIRLGPDERCVLKSAPPRVSLWGRYGGTYSIRYVREFRVVDSPSWLYPVEWVPEGARVRLDVPEVLVEDGLVGRVLALVVNGRRVGPGEEVVVDGPLRVVALFNVTYIGAPRVFPNGTRLVPVSLSNGRQWVVTSGWPPDVEVIYQREYLVTVEGPAEIPGIGRSAWVPEGGEVTVSAKCVATEAGLCIVSRRGGVREVFAGWSGLNETAPEATIRVTSPLVVRPIVKREYLVRFVSRYGSVPGYMWVEEGRAVDVSPEPDYVCDPVPPICWRFVGWDVGGVPVRSVAVTSPMTLVAVWSLDPLPILATVLAAVVAGTMYVLRRMRRLKLPGMPVRIGRE